MESSIQKSFSENKRSHQICVCHNARQFKYLDEYHSKCMKKAIPPPGSWFTTFTVGPDFLAYRITTDQHDYKHWMCNRHSTEGSKPVNREFI